jgi:hypothetical protein
MHKLTDALMHPISQIALMLGAVVLIGVLIVTAPPSPTMPTTAPIAGGMVIQAPTLWPTATPLPTAPLLALPVEPWPTPVVLPMPAVPVAPPPWPTVAAEPIQLVVTAVTEAPSAAPCLCDYDRYNCEDPGVDEQACFAYCRSLGLGDVHDFDRDRDLLVCEK